jgi:oligo-1,6-glucosidase
LAVEGAAFGTAEVEGQVVTLAGWTSVILTVRDV